MQQPDNQSPAPIVNPYEHLPSAEAKDYGAVHADYSTPEDAARIALNLRPSAQDRHQHAIESFQEFGRDIRNKTAQKLLKVVERGFEAHNKLSLLGYTNLRHLQGEGLTLSEIARDLDMNQLDIMAYMSAHPDAEDHAKIDATACADAKIRDFLFNLEHNPPATKFEADRKNIQYKVLIEQVKRISPEWAEYARHGKNEDDVRRHFNLNVTLQTPELNTTSNINNTPSLKTIEVQEIQNKQDLKPAIEIPTDSEGYYQDPLLDSEINNTNLKKIPDHDFD